MVWRTSHHSPIFLASETQQTHVEAYYFVWLLEREDFTRKSLETVTKWTSINSHFLPTLKRGLSSSFFFLFRPCKHTLHHYLFYSFYFICNFYFLFQSIFQHLINFSHNSFYTGNYCVSFTGSNLTLDPRFLFLHFLFSCPIEEFKNKSNRSVVECSRLPLIIQVL